MSAHLHVFGTPYNYGVGIIANPAMGIVIPQSIVYNADTGMVEGITPLGERLVTNGTDLIYAPYGVPYNRGRLFGANYGECDRCYRNGYPRVEQPSGYAPVKYRPETYRGNGSIERADNFDREPEDYITKRINVDDKRSALKAREMGQNLYSKEIEVRHKVFTPEGQIIEKTNIHRIVSENETVEDGFRSQTEAVKVKKIVETPEGHKIVNKSVSVKFDNSGPSEYFGEQIIYDSENGTISVGGTEYYAGKVFYVDVEKRGQELVLYTPNERIVIARRVKCVK